tara:strand:- start:231 stop:482 length:252 start_codon:yes stop_codon:yes gene_type:complete
MDPSTEEEAGPRKLDLETLKNPKVLIAAAIAALGGVLYTGDGFTVEFSTCAVEEAIVVEAPVEEAIEPEAPQEEPEEVEAVTE